MMTALPEETLDTRNERREFFRTAIGAAAITATGAAALTITSIARADTVADSSLVNFALNLEYLLGQFYGLAATGTGLPAAQLTGAGTAGAVTGGRQVTFTDPVVAQIASEFASEAAARVAFLRTTAGADVIAQPKIDLDVTATSAFSTAMRAAGLVASGTGFDVYANDSNFLLAAFFLEDLVATAYRGLVTSATNATNRESVVGLLGAAAYRAGTIRTLLYAKGAASGSTLRANADAISNVRDALDGSSDDDQGISPTTDANGNPVSNVTPAGADGIAFGRAATSVLNIVYLNSLSSSSGGFFPAGVNGTTVASAAN
ncbi:ferritin-like domain-containing protein [Sphingomonas sp. NFR15]|uniref:ferritin-like domain-containing protein n=1 Tax=Sphingomonas sp. NFR15 TaxID=1566282 RepID=UPI000B891C05|nr:ferritin-like domain-containing protein [Sphingomonas sp. NFR15]